LQVHGKLLPLQAADRSTDRSRLIEEERSFKTKTPSPDLSDEGVNLLNLLNLNQ